MKNTSRNILILVSLVILGIIIGFYNISFANSNANPNPNILGSSADTNNQALFNKVKKLEEYANSYISENNITTPAASLCLQYIRKDDYNDTRWQLVLGKVDNNFVNYVASKDSTFGFSKTDRIIDEKTGATIDFTHLMVAINVLYSPPRNVPPAYAHIVDPVYGGWAGDLMTFVEDIIKYRTTNNITDTVVIQEYANATLGTTAPSTYDEEDALGNFDAMNIHTIPSYDSNLYQTLVDYYIVNTNSNSSYNRFKTVQPQFGTRQDAYDLAMEKLNVPLVQSQLISSTYLSSLTESDLSIASTAFVEYLYREPYINLETNSANVTVNNTTNINMTGRNTDNVTLSYDKNIISVSNKGNYISIKGLKVGNTKIDFYSPEKVLKASLNVSVKNVAPSITKDLLEEQTLIIGTESVLEFSTKGTNNTYTWYLSDDTSSEGTLYKTTTTSKINILAEDFNLNNKYLRCAVSNEGNTPVFTKYTKLTIKDKAPVITKDLEQNTELKIDLSVDISFVADGSNNKYTWYIMDSLDGEAVLYQATETSSLSITATNFDLNDKYLKCGISNTGNDEIFTQATKITIIDVIPEITNNLPESISIIEGEDITLSFNSTGGSNTYSWYLSDNDTDKGEFYKNTTSPSISIKGEESLNNKYLICEVTNNTGEVVLTNAVKLNFTKKEVPSEPEDNTNNKKPMNMLLIIIPCIVVILVLVVIFLLTKKKKNINNSPVQESQDTGTNIDNNIGNNDNNLNNNSNGTNQ